jgi:hypothetical protein
MVIIKGEEKSDDGLFEHKLPNDQTAKGMLHFFKKEGKWTFLTED